MNVIRCAVLGAAALVCAGAIEAHAAVITINLATGLNVSGNRYTSGNKLDANWAVTNSNSYKTAPPNAYTVFSGNVDHSSKWAKNGPISDWIAGNPGNTNNGNLTLTRTFSLAGFNPADAILTGGEWTIDDAGTLTLNGHLLATLVSGDWTSLHSFTIPAGDFLAGVNTLVMQGVNSDDFHEGGRLQGTIQDSVSAVPEPATWGMMLIGFGLVGLQLRRRTVKEVTC